LITLQRTTIAVVGLGYVGLPTALAFAEMGAEIIGCDLSEDRLANIKTGDVDMLPWDRTRLLRQLDSFKLTTEPSAIGVADAVVVCVPTPVDPHQSPDLRALTAACANVVRYATKGQLLVLTSTTYVGCTHEMLVEPLQAAGFTVGKDIFVAFSPERIDPGVKDHAPERTPRVVGGVTPACTARAAALLRHTASSVHTVSSPESAEMTKLVENSFRAVNIALANEFSEVARELSVDVMEVIDAAATKPYGFMPFYPGPGVGGHCIPCDPHYLLWQLRARRFDSPLMRTAMTCIAARPRDVVSRAREMLAERGKPTQGARVLVVGVTYKPGVADLRESPALAIIDDLTAAGAVVSFTDPLVPMLRTPRAGTLTNHRSPEHDEWDLVLVHHWAEELTDWVSAQPVVLDTTFGRRG